MKAPTRLLKRRTEESDEITAAACTPQSGASQYQVAQRRVKKVRLVQMAADVDFDGQAQPLQASIRAAERVQSVENHLELQLVLSIHEGHYVKDAVLCVALHHGPQRGASRLFDVVKEDDRTVCRREWTASTLAGSSAAASTCNSTRHGRGDQ